MSQTTICLDPGHGGRDPGATAATLKEADITLANALSARRVVSPKYKVVLTREDDTYPTLGERVGIAERTNSDFFVSIHVNSASSGSASGYEVFVKQEASPENLLLASEILFQFSKRWPERKNRGLKHGNLFVTRQERPACLVECFFISNASDRALLTSSQNRDKIAEAIAWGCGNFIRTTLIPIDG